MEEKQAKTTDNKSNPTNTLITVGVGIGVGIATSYFVFRYIQKRMRLSREEKIDPFAFCSNKGQRELLWKENFGDKKEVELVLFEGKMKEYGWAQKHPIIIEKLKYVAKDGKVSSTNFIEEYNKFIFVTHLSQVDLEATFITERLSNYVTNAIASYLPPLTCKFQHSRAFYRFDQEMFECHNCNTGNMCLNCAKDCHKGHWVETIGMRNDSCNCHGFYKDCSPYEPRIADFEYIISRGADLYGAEACFQRVFLSLEFPREFKLLLIKNAKDPNVNMFGKTPVQIESLKTNPDFEVLKLLVERKADLNVLDSENQTILFRFCEMPSPPLKLIEFLLEKKIDANVPDRYLKTPLHYICYGNESNTELLKLLISKGADVNERDSFQLTPIFYSSFKAQQDTVQVECLLANGADPTLCNANGASFVSCLPLELQSNLSKYNIASVAGGIFGAIERKEVETIKYLLGKGASPNCYTDSLKSALILICEQEELCTSELLQFLITKKADLNFTDDRERICLHYLSSKKSPNIQIGEV